MQDLLKEKIPSQSLRWALYALGALLVVLLIFHAGYVAGARHRFVMPGERSPGWDFRAPGFGTVRFPRTFLPLGHGAVGIIRAVSTSTLTIENRDGETQTVLLTNRTMFRDFEGIASSSALSPGTQVIILGIPSEGGQLSAEIVRVLPPASTSQRSPQR